MEHNWVIGTAGHIDHGKSALVKALTGIDPDRLKEEKERGITIDLGFASLDLSPGFHLGIVDVPGHERFIKNMLAGVGGIDAVLLVVAADEGIMPQTREHFAICRLLKIRTGVVALTKADLVEQDVLELIRMEIQEFLQGSFLEGAPIVPVSSLTGEGLDQLKQALLQLGRQMEFKNCTGTFRLPIDRCFTLHGHGTIVTGTLLSGTLTREMEVEIYPSGKRSRVRNIQVHSESVGTARAGQRTAVNLQGVEVSDIQRGMVLSLPHRFKPVSVLEVSLHMLADSPVPLNPRTRIHFHQGTAELIGTLSPLMAREIPPGGYGFAKAQLETPILTLPGDHFIIRRFSPMATIGGGDILDIHPPKRKSDPSAHANYLEVMASANWTEILFEMVHRSGRNGISEAELLASMIWEIEWVLTQLDKLDGSGRVKILSRSPLLVIGTMAYQSLKGDAMRKLHSFHDANPLVPGMPKEHWSSTLFAGTPLVFKAVMEELLAEGKIILERERVLIKGRGISLNHQEAAAKDCIEEAFRKTGWRVPDFEEVFRELNLPREQMRRLVALLIKEKKLVKITDDLLFHTQAIERLKEILTNQKKVNEKIDIRQFKALTDVSRKYAIPLLEYLDREKVTRRAGEQRIIL